MATTILDTIALFENAAWTPAQLAAQRKLSGHARAFQKLWDAIDSAVSDSGYQTRGRIFRSAVAPPESPAVWMDGFVNLSPVESEFVTALAQSCDLTITLADTPATHAIRVFAMQLKAQDRLLPGVARKPEITTVAAPNMEREADEIARRILALHERGVPFREIGVALREASVYHPLLQGTFDRFGIPARFYFSSPLRHTPRSRLPRAA